MIDRFMQFRMLVHNILTSDMPTESKLQVINDLIPMYRREYLTDICIFKDADRRKQEFDAYTKLLTE